jgi:protein involved in polysaccharide export with SLBB domain
MIVSRVVLAGAVVLCVLVRPSLGQAQGSSRDGDGGTLGLVATREALEARADRLEQATRSGTLSKDARADAALEAAAIRRRLARGDFAVGDRVLLSVEGEKELSDTFTVGPGGMLSLPAVGDVSLAGVLRAELQPYLARRLAESLRDPVVRARAFVRVSVQGAVPHPGFYAVPADALLSDALMAAGGTLPEADLKKLRIERDGAPIWRNGALRQAIAEGRTLDGAGLVAGDQFVVPRHGGASAGDVLRFGAFILTVPVTIYTLTRIF